LSLFLSGGAFSAQTAAKTYANSIGMEFILIPSGSFMMGADKNFEDAEDDETPQHRVSISKPFYLGKYEVTQAQWTAVMGKHQSRVEGRSNPVEEVSWNDVQEFIRRLNQMEGHNRYTIGGSFGPDPLRRADSHALSAGICRRLQNIAI
jgi:formylglycine-generating enzyme required for sulfatase activity